MWSRKQLDVNWADFAFGLRKCFTFSHGADQNAIVRADWIAPHEALVTLSVRTGWDLLLEALHLPAGSEVLMSEVTIPDMPRIVEHHGLVPVPVGVDPDRLEPNIDALERAISPRTRAILVAHLFGSRIEMGPVVEVARIHRLLVVEDCAQAFVGREYSGHVYSDCCLFSFGPIKTASALGGAVLRVRDPNLRARMATIERAYPLQSRRAYAARLLKYLSFRCLSKRRVYAALVRGYGAFGIDYDEALSHAAHSFGQHNFFERIRHRPCGPLLRMLERRISTFENCAQALLGRRAEQGHRFANSLPDGMVVGSQNESHTYWAMPLRVQNTPEVIAALREAGFDATARSSLVVIPSPAAESLDEGNRPHWLAETLFLPNGDDMPDDEWHRMSTVVRQVARAVVQPAQRSPTIRARELVSPARVTLAS
jgi:dTDP-4-amino-4,6-dideoxygalactose transaminase